MELTFRGEESALLERRAEVSRQMPLTSFEVRGDLEQIFVQLVQERS